MKTNANPSQPPAGIDSQTWVNTTPKGEYRGYAIYKYEGVPGLALPKLPYWYAVRDGSIQTVHDTRKGVKAVIDFREEMTDQQRAAYAQVAARIERALSR